MISLNHEFINRNEAERESSPTSAWKDSRRRTVLCLEETALSCFVCPRTKLQRKNISLVSQKTTQRRFWSTACSVVIKENLGHCQDSLVFSYLNLFMFPLCCSDYSDLSRIFFASWSAPTLLLLEQMRAAAIFET